MLLRIVRSNSPIVLFLLLIITVALWYPSIKGIPISPFSFDYHKMPLYKIVYQTLNDHHTLHILVVVFLVFIESLFLLKFNRQHILLETQNYLPALLFIILTSSFIQLQRLNPGIFSAFFLILMLDQLLLCYKEKYVLNRLFLAGLFVAISSLFYSYSVFFFLIIWVALILLRGFNIREWFVPILGLIFPYLFVFGFYYLSDNYIIPDFLNLVVKNFTESTTITHYNFAYYLLAGFVGLLLIIGSFKVLNSFPARKIYIRKYFEVFLWIFLLGVILFVFIQGVSVEIVYIIAFPLSFLLANYFNAVRSGVWGNLFLFILAGLIALVYYTNG